MDEIIVVVKIRGEGTSVFNFEGEHNAREFIEEIRRVKKERITALEVTPDLDSLQVH